MYPDRNLCGGFICDLHIHFIVYLQDYADDDLFVIMVDIILKTAFDVPNNFIIM